MSHHDGEMDRHGSGPEESQYGPGLRALRRQRCLLWGVILLYVPQMWITAQLTHSNRAVGVAFGIWFIFLVKAGLPVAFAPCPRCGNYFHLKNFNTLYVRRCRHCGLHINADRKP